MSYNIHTWKTIKIKDLRIPFESFYKCYRRDWHPQYYYKNNNIVTIEVGECDGIVGEEINCVIYVKDINIAGECSGSYMEYVVEPALKESKGYLEAVCIWEGGESINKLIVNNGDVKWEEIEL